MGRPTARLRPRCGIQISQLEEVRCPTTWAHCTPRPPPSFQRPRATSSKPVKTTMIEPCQPSHS